MKTPFQDDLQKALSQKAIMGALFENYESIYAVNITTSSYRCYHESDSYEALKMDISGDDFFADMEENVSKIIYFEDQEYVKKMLSKELMLKGLEKEKYYSFVYRLGIDGEPLYHKLRATKDVIGGQPFVLIGIRNIDSAYRSDRQHSEEIAAFHKKERNHLEAIMAGASGYVEANITKNKITEISPTMFSEGLLKGFYCSDAEKSVYSAFEKWTVENVIVENREKYIHIGSREYLIDCFKNGERRASVSFSARTLTQNIRQCKKVFYLYQDDVTEDILSFCVVYDLTEQQRKEKELHDLEEALQLSRIQNFTSQMQPHFLYNTLNSIQEILLEDPQYASDLIGDFTVHLRSCIRAMANDAPMPFTHELENIKAYVNIEKMRFGEKLNVKYDIEAEDFSILPLSVQPIVENAIRHGVYERGIAGGTVCVSSKETPESFEISVKDDGVGFDVKEYEKNLAEGSLDSTGLKNVIFRLEKVMNAKVSIQSRKDKGTKVTITIPKEVKNESDHS